MNYLITLYRSDTYEYQYLTVFGSEGEIGALAENLARMISDASSLPWEVYHTSFISDVYPLQAR